MPSVVFLIVMLGVVMLNAIALSNPLVLILSSVENRAICVGTPTFNIMTLSINDIHHKLYSAEPHYASSAIMLSLTIYELKS
jgi:hypothetical protein